VKNLLVTSAILLSTAGLAAADVTLSGSARMGVIDDFGPDNTGFTSRARVDFTMTGITDGGLSFGASFRADQAGSANVGDEGIVFLSGAFGKLSMGDLESAAEQAIGQVSGVGLTGLDDLNEVTYVGDNNGAGPSVPMASYEYSRRFFTLYLSAVNPSAVTERYAVGLKFATDNYSVSLGYETVEDGPEQIAIGATGTLGPVTGKVIYGEIDEFGDGGQLAVSLDYQAEALTVTGFALQDFTVGGDRYGLGAAYDLGGGARVVGGYVKDNGADQDAFDLGVAFNF
jgi:outer membrane protein OmpU